MILKSYSCWKYTVSWESMSRDEDISDKYIKRKPWLLLCYIVMQQRKVQLHNLWFHSSEAPMSRAPVNGEEDEYARYKRKLRIVTLLSRTAVTKYWIPLFVIWLLVRRRSVSVCK
jgi:hypothetical protein